MEVETGSSTPVQQPPEDNGENTEVPLIQVEQATKDGLTHLDEELQEEEEQVLIINYEKLGLFGFTNKTF